MAVIELKNYLVLVGNLLKNLRLIRLIWVYGFFVNLLFYN